MEDDGTDMNLRVRRKVEQQLHSALHPDDAEDEKDKLAKKDIRQSPYSIQNFCWLLVAASTFYFTDFLNVMWYDPAINSNWFNVGAVLIAVNVCIAAYLIVYLSWIKKVSSDHWEQHYPAAIPIATASFAFGSFCITIALWPVWGVFTPVILFALMMGAVVTIAMIPAF